MRTRPVWCAQARDKLWCAVKPNKKPKEGVLIVKTVCYMSITLPWGLEKKVPNCKSCRTHVREAQGC